MKEASLTECSRELETYVATEVNKRFQRLCRQSAPSVCQQPLHEVRAATTAFDCDSAYAHSACGLSFATIDVATRLAEDYFS